jgi:CRISPR system Cascade subunit CasC
MRTNNRLYLDVHILQTVPPSCINRDDTGSPKTALYGGVMRARVSSQSWKRAMRMMFRELFEPDKLGLRTKKIVGLVAGEIDRIGGAPDPEAAAQRVLETAGLRIRSVDNGTDTLFFISAAQARALAVLAVTNPETIQPNPTRDAKMKAQEALRKSPGIDIALFGRMVADDPSLNTDACAQVAHSLSTHKILTEYDYFTAVDDMAPEDNAGAGHIGSVEFYSATLYRYATVAVHELFHQIDEDAVDAACAFVRTFTCSMPSGMQTSFANRSLPDALMVAVRADQPVNLVGAFERPVSAGEVGFVTASAKRLVSHAQSVHTSFAGNPVLTLVTGELLSELGTPQSLSMLLASLEVELRQRLENREIEQ